MGTSPQHRPAYKKLCRRLRQMRNDASLTQRGLAEILKKPHSFVAKVEHGDRRIDPIEFADWCRACGVKASKELKAYE